MKKLFLLLVFALFSISLSAQVPATNPVIKTETWIAQAGAPSSPILNQKYLSTDGSYYRWDGAAWMLDVAPQSLSLSGKDLSLSGGGGTIDLSTIDQTAAEISYDNTTSGLTAIDIQSAVDEVSAASTDNQNISGSGLAGTDLTIGIEGGTGEIIDLSALVGSDNQVASEVNITDAGANFISTEVEGALAELAAGSTDDQNISGSGLAGTDLTIGIEGGTNEIVDLSSLVGTDDQNLTGATLTGNSLQIDIEGGNSATVDLSPLDNTGTDNQNISGSGLLGTDLTIGIESGTGEIVDLSSLVGTDNQTAAEVSYNNATSLLTAVEVQAAIDEIEARVDLNDAKITNTDAQDLTLVTNTLAISGDPNTDVDLSIYLDNTDNQIASEVTIDDSGALYTSSNVEDALAEVKAIADAAAGGGLGGTIADNQIVIGNGTNAIDGSADFTWDGTQLGIIGSSADRYIRFAETAGQFNGAFMQYEGLANKFHLGVHSLGDALPVNDTKILTMQRADGFIGINNVSPGYELDVNGTFNSTGARIAPTFADFAGRFSTGGTPSFGASRLGDSDLQTATLDMGSTINFIDGTTPQQVNFSIFENNDVMTVRSSGGNKIGVFDFNGGNQATWDVDDSESTFAATLNFTDGKSYVNDMGVQRYIPGASVVAQTFFHVLQNNGGAPEMDYWFGRYNGTTYDEIFNVNAAEVVDFEQTPVVNGVAISTGAHFNGVFGSLTGVPAGLADGDDDTIADGSETIINQGTNVTITGTGTSGSPYVINSTSGGADGLGPDGIAGEATIGGAGTTITLNADVITQSKIADDAIQEEHLKAVNAAVDGYVMTYQLAGTGIEYIDPSSMGTDDQNAIEVLVSASPVNYAGGSGYVENHLSGIDAEFGNKQDNITLTTTGTSEAATLISGTLNIPQYLDTKNNQAETKALVDAEYPNLDIDSTDDVTALDDLSDVNLVAAAQFEVLTYNGASWDNQFMAAGSVTITDTGTYFTSSDVEGALQELGALGSGTDDQTAAEVPFTPTGNTIATDVQGAVVELQTEVDGIAVGSGVIDPITEAEFNGLSDAEKLTYNGPLKVETSSVGNGSSGLTQAIVSAGKTIGIGDLNSFISLDTTITTGNVDFILPDIGVDGDRIVFRTFVGDPKIRVDAFGGQDAQNIDNTSSFQYIRKQNKWWRDGGSEVAVFTIPAIYQGANAATVPETDATANIDLNGEFTVATVGTPVTEGTRALEFTRTLATGTSAEAYIQLVGSVADATSYTISVDAQEMVGTTWDVGLILAHGWTATETISVNAGAISTYTLNVATTNTTNFASRNPPTLRIRSISAGNAGDILVVDNIVMTAN